MNSMLKKFAVLGNPITHSLSPFIHQSFGKQLDIKLSYEKISLPEEEFEYRSKRLLVEQKYSGLNITLPFKERAVSLCQQLTSRATQARAVNTLFRNAMGECLGDNTDGIGLLTDLQRLTFIKPSDHILLLGAGGAARGIIVPLLQYGCRITIANRTHERAVNLASDFSKLGEIHYCEINQLAAYSFDLIINATSTGIAGNIPILPKSYNYSVIRCYDLYYQVTLTPFLSWVTSQGCIEYSDGLGMLVAQAAHAFHLWHGVLPDIASTLKETQHLIRHSNI